MQRRPFKHIHTTKEKTSRSFKRYQRSLKDQAPTTYKINQETNNRHQQGYKHRNRNFPQCKRSQLSKNTNQDVTIHRQRRMYQKFRLRPRLFSPCLQYNCQRNTIQSNLCRPCKATKELWSHQRLCTIPNLFTRMFPTIQHTSSTTIQQCRPLRLRSYRKSCRGYPLIEFEVPNSKSGASPRLQHPVEGVFASAVVSGSVRHCTINTSVNNDRVYSTIISLAANRVYKRPLSSGISYSTNTKRVLNT